MQDQASTRHREGWCPSIRLNGQRQQVLTGAAISQRIRHCPSAGASHGKPPPEVPDGLSDKMLTPSACSRSPRRRRGGVVPRTIDGTIRASATRAPGRRCSRPVPSFPAFGTNGWCVPPPRDADRQPRENFAGCADAGLCAKGATQTSSSRARSRCGKSTTAVNLAIARHRRPQKPSPRPTCTGVDRTHLAIPPHRPQHYLLEESEAILTEVPGIPNLTAVTSGHPVETPAELLASSRVSELVKLLEENHDLVFFDTPPVLNASDSLALASRVDGVIVVIDTRTTTSSDLEQLRD